MVGFTFDDGECPPTNPGFRVTGVPWQTPELYAQMQSSDTDIAQQAHRRLAGQNAEPWIASWYESPQLRAAIGGALAQEIDLALIGNSFMGHYADMIPPGVARILDLPDLHWRSAAREAGSDAGELREAERIRRFERSVISAADLVLTVSDLEAEIVRDAVPDARVAVVANGVDAAAYTPSAAPPTRGFLLFTGLMSYRPNVAGVSWFEREILPLLPPCILHVVGAAPGAETLDLASDRLTVHGAVPDMQPFQNQAHVVVVPLLSGSGTRLKILEAAASGNAIVSTTVGAEGLDLVPDRDILIADTPHAFAAAVTAVLADDALRHRLGSNARVVAERYDWSRIERAFIGALEPLLARHGSR